MVGACRPHLDHRPVWTILLGVSRARHRPCPADIRQHRARDTIGRRQPRGGRQTTATPRRSTHSSASRSNCRRDARELDLEESLGRAQSGSAGRRSLSLGKIAVPEPILLNSPARDRRGATIMWLHTRDRERASILGQFSPLPVRGQHRTHHHAAYDGSGYPPWSSHGEAILDRALRVVRRRRRVRRNDPPIGRTAAPCRARKRSHGFREGAGQQWDPLGGLMRCWPTLISGASANADEGDTLISPPLEPPVPSRADADGGGAAGDGGDRSAEESQT
jgi:hypothetical protein